MWSGPKKAVTLQLWEREYEWLEEGPGGAYDSCSRSGATSIHLASKNRFLFKKAPLSPKGKATRLSLKDPGGPGIQ